MSESMVNTGDFIIDSNGEYDVLYEAIVKEHDLIVKATYPESPRDENGRPLYKYETSLEVIDFDEECKMDLIRNKGFLITKKQNINKDLKSDDGIFSSKYGGINLDDIKPFAHRYRCKCGRLEMKINNGLTCSVCGTKCKMVGDDFEYTGWIKLEEPAFFIQPNLFKKLTIFIGKKNMDSILNAENKINEDGFNIQKEGSKSNPFVSIGMMGFRERFDEIMEFFKNKNQSNKNKMEYYYDIMSNYNKIFCHSIPVYTLMLRPISIKNNVFNFEGNNALYNVIAGLAKRVNKKQYMRNKLKPINQTLYDIQMKFMEIYADCEKLLAGKKGYIRSMNGGRYNFTARNVIKPDPELAIDEIILPYTTLIELLSLTIINILTKTMTPAEAYEYWDSARIKYNPTIGNLIQSILDREYIGIMLNRNPSISPASMLQMRCVRVTKNDSYACSLPHEILVSMNADFDGDTLNINLIINQEFLVSAARLFNPRLAMQISYKDGMFNDEMMLQKDTLICLNSFNRLGFENIPQSNIDKIEEFRKRHNCL